MRHLIVAVIAGAMTLLAHDASAADDKMTIAVFTKNSTNPAYEAFRIAADQIARTTGAKVVHFVPKQPDNVDEQKAMVEQVIKDKPDAIIFIPVDDVAMVPSVKLLNDAKIPVVLVSNPLPGSFVTYVGADDFEIGYREARYLFEHLGGKGKIVVIEGTPAAPPTASGCAVTSAPSANFPASRCWARRSAITRRPTPSAEWRSCWPNTSRSMRCCRPMTAWRSACSTRSRPPTGRLL